MRTKQLQCFLTAVLVLLLFSFAAQGKGRPFITRWKGEAGKELYIPIQGENYKLVIKKADGTVLKTETSLTITNYRSYPYTPSESSELIVEAGPEGVTAIEFDTYYKSAKALLCVEQFGTVQWQTMKKAFYDCENMQFAAGIDTPDLSQVTSMSEMFFGCTSFNQPLNSWDVSKVTSMSSMFSYCTSFNQPLNSWDVSKVTDMSAMFCGRTIFNQPLNSWDVSKVTDMSWMFYGCTTFNQPLNNWDVSKVTDMSWMFHGCTSFNQPLNSWDVSKVTDMSDMFHGCTSFNQSLNNWDVSKVTNMSSMFSGCTSFNQPLNSWDVSKVNYMGGMFRGCTSFNQPLNNWDVSNVWSMEGIFRGCSSFNQELGMWKLEECKKLGLDNCGMSAENYSKSLEGWAAQNDIDIYLTLDATGLKYFLEAAGARAKLINSKRWRIEGDVLVRHYLSFEEKTRSLTKGAVHTLVLTKKGIDENETVMLTSSAPTTVRIIDATSLTIKGLKTGKATITATVAANGSHEKLVATCEVFVTIPVSGVTLSQTELPLVKGATATLSATVVPADATNKQVTWSSTNTAVATVENGIVTAVSGGNATIKVTTEDGNHTATCEVLVTVPVTGVTLSQTELPLVKGATATLTATIVPSDATNQKVTWRSNNTSIATVENGTVTAVSGGTVTITVTTEDGNHTARCEVTVTVSATGVTLLQTELPLAKGATATLTATVAPSDATNQKVTWRSSNTSIATVENGTVTAVSAGNATITVTTEDGNHTATCEVTVTVSATGVTLSQTELPLAKGATATLRATVVPSDATNQKVRWSSNNTAVATVENGTVTAVSGGNATITVTTEDGNHTATCSVAVEATSAVEDAVFASVVVSPNPFGEQLCITYGDLRGQYVLYNAQGVVVASEGLEDGETRINTASFTAGVYLLRLTAENGATKNYTVVKD